MNAQVTLHRASGFCDLMRAYIIVVDGEDWGPIKRNSSVVLDLPPGMHEITARIDWCSGNVLYLDLIDGAQVDIDIANPHKPWQLNKIMTHASDTYLSLTLR